MISTVLRAVEDGCRQVVLVAAGLDSRAFRLGLPKDATVFELDQAAVLDFKQAVLDEHEVVPTCKPGTGCRSISGTPGRPSFAGRRVRWDAPDDLDR